MEAFETVELSTDLLIVGGRFSYVVAIRPPSKFVSVSSGRKS